MQFSRPSLEPAADAPVLTFRPFPLNQSPSARAPCDAPGPARCLHRPEVTTANWHGYQVHVLAAGFSPKTAKALFLSHRMCARPQLPPCPRGTPADQAQNLQQPSIHSLTHSLLLLADPCAGAAAASAAASLIGSQREKTAVCHSLCFFLHIFSFSRLIGLNTSKDNFFKFL